MSISLELCLILLASSVVTKLSYDPTHALGISTISWLLTFIYSLFGKASGDRSLKSKNRQRYWLVGVLFVLTQLCVSSITGALQQSWLPEALLPLALLAHQWLQVDTSPVDFSITEPSDTRCSTLRESKQLPIIFTIFSLAVLFRPNFLPSEIALGFGALLGLSVAYTLLDGDLLDSKQPDLSGSLSPFPLKTFSRSQNAAGSTGRFITATRDVSAAAALASCIAALLIESSLFEALNNERSGRQCLIQLLQRVAIALFGSVQNTLLLAMVEDQGALPTTLLELSAMLGANLLNSFSFLSTYFSSISILAIYLFVSKTRSAKVLDYKIDVRKVLSIVSAISFVVFTFSLLRNPGNVTFFSRSPQEVQHRPNPFDPGSSTHLITQLIDSAETEFESIRASQSKSLEEAVREYQRRYNTSPPPHFDKWYEFAIKRDTQLIDEYDGIFDSILPFWAVEPSVLRARVREALGYSENSNRGHEEWHRNYLFGASIRNGTFGRVGRNGEDEWHREAIEGMTAGFVKFLPDMDIGFNLHDEPRVILPYGDLQRLIEVAKARLTLSGSRNVFSPPSIDMTPVPDIKYTRFNRVDHQNIWTDSRLSCPLDTPARSLSETPVDSQIAYTPSGIGFIQNETARSDVCLTPSLHNTHGFFDSPNAYSVVHELYPIFSPSKPSTHQDILFPSPWYWMSETTYDPSVSVDWANKEEQMYWRGATSGGFSQDGRWQRHHRQHIVQLLNSNKTAMVMEQSHKGDSAWTTKEVLRDEYSHLFDVRFSAVQQCDDNDCEAQREAFDIAPRAQQSDAWQYKHLLDMDGNALSGRFYAFLQSKSLVYKMAIFREWHMDWLKPWVHYVPLSLNGTEWVEAMRWFSSEEQGREQAKKIANDSSVWAEQTLNNEALEVFFFRLLLEYGRVIDDNRDQLGYSLP